MDDFEELLEQNCSFVERLVRFQIHTKADGDDLIQEVYLTAYEKFHQLKNKDSFKFWIISIARNKCNDYFRKKAAQLEIPIDAINEKELTVGRYGVTETSTVKETLELLGSKDKQILYLYYWKELPQSEIAKRLNLPLGTVKSRLYTAKRNFKNQYPYGNRIKKGEIAMNKLPEILPEYQIEESREKPFAVKWEELMGWFLVPKLGEKLSWGMYDMPSRKCSYVYDMKVVGKAKVHGIEGVELTAREKDCGNKGKVIERTFVAQLTDTHCRYLATIRKEGDVRNFITFLDGEEFMPSWGYGEDNIGNETNLAPRGKLKRNGNAVTSIHKDYLLDIVGRYTVTIGNKSYDTVCVMNIESFNGGVVSEQFLDKNGKTILWRRFNRNDWAIDHYRKKWSELLPGNQQLMINGETYVHWYDCISDYILL